MEFTVTAVFQVEPERIYNAWLDSKEHSKMTGAKASVSRVVGGKFNAWDGYIRGENIELIEGKKIVQNWRTVEFTKDEEDSIVEIVLSPHREGAKLTLKHSRLPAHGMQYKSGWQESYFDPMQKYFG